MFAIYEVLCIKINEIFAYRTEGVIIRYFSSSQNVLKVTIFFLCI